MVLVVRIPYEVFPFKVLCALPAITEYLKGLVVFAFVALSKSIYEQSHTYTSYKSAEFVSTSSDLFLFPRCCQAHDHCYSEAQNKTICSSILDTPYTEIYKYSCKDEEITCSSTCCPVSAVLCVTVPSLSGRNGAAWPWVREGCAAGGPARRSAVVMLPTWCAAQREPRPPLGVQPRAELSGQYCIAVPHGCSAMAETPGGEERPTWSWGPPAEMGQHVAGHCAEL